MTSWTTATTPRPATSCSTAWGAWTASPAATSAAATSLTGSFTNIDVLRGSNQSDRLAGPDLYNHWDFGADVSGFGFGLTWSPGTGHNGGVLLAPDRDMLFTGNDTRFGVPGAQFGYGNPIQPSLSAQNTTLPQNLAFVSFENLVGSANFDDWFDWRGEIRLDGTLDAGGGTDTLDFRGLIVDLTVDLVAGTATYINGGNPGGLRPGTGADVGNSVENVIGGNGNDKIYGDADHNILGDGFGSDILHGGSGGNDTFRLEPGQASGTGRSDDYILNPGSDPNDTVDFRFANTLWTPPNVNTGIIFDLDLTAWDADGVIDINNIAGTLDQPNPQDVVDGVPGALAGSGGASSVNGHTVTLVSVGAASNRRPPARSKTWWGANTTTCCSSIRWRRSAPSTATRAGTCWTSTAAAAR